jgi:hypothetical protein
MLLRRSAVVVASGDDIMAKGQAHHRILIIGMVGLERHGLLISWLPCLLSAKST